MKSYYHAACGNWLDANHNPDPEEFEEDSTMHIIAFTCKCKIKPRKAKTPVAPASVDIQLSLFTH